MCIRDSTNAVDGAYNLVITNIPFNLDINSQQRAPYDLDINNGNAAAIQHVIKSLRKDTNNSRGEMCIRDSYITDEQYRELKILAVENDTDTSSLVREALDQFLNNK